jgi:hypothetical protein
MVLSGHQQSSVVISRLHAARLLLAHDHEDEYIHQRSSVVISSHQLACFWPTTMKMSTWKNGTASGIGSIGDAPDEGCNQHAISMQSACNQHAISMPPASDPSETH